MTSNTIHSGRRTLRLAIPAAIAGLMAASAPAHGQSYGSAPYPPPLYPYAVQSQPRGLFVPQQSAPRDYPYVRCVNGCTPRAGSVHENGNPPVEPDVMADFNRHKHADRELIEELRTRGKATRKTVNTLKIVRDPPTVIETRRIVDDPPVVVERGRYSEDPAIKRRHGKRDAIAERKQTAAEKPVERKDGKPRVIHAEAEVTIIGPDRMSIRLFRKGRGKDANALSE